MCAEQNDIPIYTSGAQGNAIVEKVFAQRSQTRQE